MDLATLYPLVTDAIRRAEVLEDINAPGARNAYMDVSLLEERIADLLPVTDQEGAIARRGAVSAAIDAREFTRADALAARYAAEDGISDSLRAELAGLRSQTATAIVGRHAQRMAAATTSSCVFAFISGENDGSDRAQARVFSSLSEAREFLMATDMSQAARIEIYIRADSADEWRNVVQQALSVTSS